MPSGKPQEVDDPAANLKEVYRIADAGWSAWSCYCSNNDLDPLDVPAMSLYLEGWHDVRTFDK